MEMLKLYYETGEFKVLKYIVRYPNDYTDGKKYPVIFFLHGAGSRGKDTNILLGNPFFSITEKHLDFPFITVAPQCDKDNWFELMNNLQELTAEIMSFNFTDTERIYAVGASMGGYAVWQLAMNMPSAFAAIIPICGGGMYWNAQRLTGTPIWAFHGDSDKVVYTEESVKMVEKVNAAGGSAMLTIYENTGHDSWTETYSDYKVFSWLLKHKNTYTEQSGNRFNNSKVYG